MLAEPQRRILLDTAWRSIHHGLQSGVSLRVEATAYEAPLSEAGASFVTLHNNGELRGCIGTLEAVRPLISDVAENAYAAAFRDPRFAPLCEAELDALTLDVSVLSRPEPIRFTDEADLLGQLQPGRDGLILQDKQHRGTFLPSVWALLPEPRRFLEHLKLKAGLPAGHWSSDMRIWRYRTESFGGCQSPRAGAGARG